jgi:RimJ/RimL family protein N-acetyltransferase
MTPIRTVRLVLRNWEERDRDLFHRINSDDRVMEFFGFRRDRSQSDALLDTLRDRIDQLGYGFTAAEIADTGQCIGFVGLMPTDLEPFFPDGTVEVGWRLAPEFWGRGYVTEAAHAWLEFAFERLGLDELVSFAVWNNVRSTAVMRRLGMKADPASDFDHPRVPDTHPELKPHVVYRLSAGDWRASR